jgi:hypothetical protein
MLPIDAHAHFQPSWNPARFLDATWDNLHRFAVSSPDGMRHRAGIGSGAPPCACVFLSDPRGANGVDRLRRAVDSGQASKWTIARSGERSYTVDSLDGGPILIVAGRQLVTTDGLEVLTPGVREWNAPMPLRETLCAVAEAGGVPIVPWGFGKWWGRRGRILDAAIREPPGGVRFHLSDSALRPAVIRRPRPLAIGADRGIYDLPGTDPLPLDRQETRAGSFGFGLADALDADDSVESILDRLRGLEAQPPRFGSRNRVTTFVAGQIALRTRPRRPVSAEDAGPRYLAGR